MSGLALIMKGKGFKVQGSDIANNKNIERLRKEKIKVFIGHKRQNIEKGTILVISSAIKKNKLQKLNYQNTWNNVNQKILKIINEN